MAGLGRKVFTAGDVLTASDVQNYLMDQTVMNFAGTAARSSAIATPTDGMVTYNQTTDSLEAYNGTAYINLSGLQLIKKQTVGSAVTSVTLTGVFSAIYENYRVIISGVDGSAVAAYTLTFGSTATGYYGSQYYDAYTGTSGTDRINNLAFLQSGITAIDDNSNCSFDVINPFLAKRTSITGSFNAGLYTGWFGGSVFNTTSYTAFTISAAGGVTLTGGTISVYGYGQ